MRLGGGLVGFAYNSRLNGPIPIAPSAVHSARGRHQPHPALGERLLKRGEGGIVVAYPGVRLG